MLTLAINPVVKQNLFRKEEINMEEKIQDKEQLRKSIDELLNETMLEWEELRKSNTLQSDENGDMPQLAGQSNDQFQNFKKEDESHSENKEEDIKDMGDEEDKEDDDKKEEEGDASEENKEMDKSEGDEIKEIVKSCLFEVMEEMGLIKAEDKEEDEEEKDKEEDDDKKEDFKEKFMKKSDNDNFAKSLVDKLDNLGDDMKKMQERIEELSRRPATGRRSVSGLQPIQKSEGDKVGSTVNKQEALEALYDKMEKGDKRITPQLITQVETGYIPLNSENLKKLL